MYTYIAGIGWASVVTINFTLFMTAFYNIAGVLIGIISILMLKQHSFISKDRPELRSVAKLLHIIFLLASISMFAAQFEAKLPYNEFEKLNPLMLLIFFLIGQGYAYMMLILLNQSKFFKLNYLKRVVLPIFLLFSAYTVLYFIFGDQQIYSGAEFLELLPHHPMLIFRCVLLVATVFSSFYSMWLCRKLRGDYHKQIVRSLSEIKMKQSIGMSQIQLSVESLAVWALLTYFYTSPILEVVSCTLLTLMLAFQFNGFRNYARYQVAGMPFLVYRIEDVGSETNISSNTFLSYINGENKTVEITKTSKYEKLLTSFRKLIEEDKIFRQNTLRADDVASSMHTNRTYLSRMIKEEFQCTFSDYINARRVEFAKELMRSDPDMRQDELADKSGFIGAPSFSRTFKQIEGIPPKEWCRNHIHRT